MELDPHMMRKLEIAFTVMDEQRKSEMERQPPDE